MRNRQCSVFYFSPRAGVTRALKKNSFQCIHKKSTSYNPDIWSRYLFRSFVELASPEDMEDVKGFGGLSGQRLVSVEVVLTPCAPFKSYLLVRNSLELVSSQEETPETPTRILSENRNGCLVDCKIDRSDRNLPNKYAFTSFRS